MPMLWRAFAQLPFTDRVGHLAAVHADASRIGALQRVDRCVSACSCRHRSGRRRRKFRRGRRTARRRQVPGRPSPRSHSSSRSGLRKSWCSLWWLESSRKRFRKSGAEIVRTQASKFSEEAGAPNPNFCPRSTPWRPQNSQSRGGRLGSSRGVRKCPANREDSGQPRRTERSVTRSGTYPEITTAVGRQFSGQPPSLVVRRSSVMSAARSLPRRVLQRLAGHRLQGLWAASSAKPRVPAAW